MVSTGVPERVWQSDGILHIRGQANENRFDGTCGGDPCVFGVPFVVNVELNTATGDGTVFGTFAYVVDGTRFAWGDHIGSFDGPFWGQITAGVVTIKFVAEGSGDFDGMKLMGTGLVPLAGPHPIEGTILDPHG